MSVYELLTLFLQSLSVDRSPRTIRWYDEQVRRFLHWLAANRLHNGNWLSREIIEQYLAASRASGNQPATVAGHYRALRGFFAWLVERQHIPISPMSGMKPPAVPPKEPRRTELDEYLRLLESISSFTWIDNRDRLIITTLFLCGVRLGECTRLAANDYRIAEHLLRVDGKTGVRLVPLLPAVERALVAYLFCRPESALSQLFLAADGARHPRLAAIQEKGIYQMIRRRCIRANLRPLNPHSFRHGLAMYLLNKGGDMSLVQKVLGHSQISTTAKHYANWLTEGLVDEYTAKMKGVGK
jgi:site-specific recombinase XerD